jgi:hypothetical protein
LGVDYSITELFSVGPAFEYLSRHVEPSAISKHDIKYYGFYLDFRANYNFTDSGYSFMVLGFGSGINHLNEDKNSEGTGFALYGIIGLDLSISGPVGCDLIYRYQLAEIKAPFREYRYNGSVIQVGLNYRFKF